MLLNKKLNEFYPVRVQRGYRVGIELEYEGWDGEDWQGDWWHTTQDTSLRNNGVELVSDALLQKNIPAALDEAQEFIDRHGLISNSRCGVHAHLNFSDKTLREVWNMTTLGTLLEPYMFQTYCDGRWDNHFCVPTSVNTHLQVNFQNDIRNLRKRVRPFMLACVQDAKYCAVNYKRLANLGTLEYRQHSGTADMAVVRKWVEFLLKIQKVSAEYEDPLDILDEYDDIGLGHLLEKVGEPVVEVNQLRQLDAEDAAAFIVGYKETNWKNLDWNIEPVAIGIREEAPNEPVDDLLRRIAFNLEVNQEAVVAGRVAGRHREREREPMQVDWQEFDDIDLDEIEEEEF